MSSLSELGLLYVYLLLIILVISFGYLTIRWAISLTKWVQKLSLTSNDMAGSKSINLREVKLGWVKLSLICASILMLSVFSIGVLKTIGAGSEGHEHQTASPINSQPYQAPVYYPITPNTQQNHLQAQINYMLYQLNTMETSLNRVP